MKNTAQQIFAISFHSLVKNRLGPYKLVIKNDAGTYVATDTQVSNLYGAYDYLWHTFPLNAIQKALGTFNDPTYYRKHIRGSNLKSYLTTAAGDIELLEKDFK